MKRLFEFGAKVIMALGWHLGTIYMYQWPRFGLTWFDHRFDYLRGPAFWFWAERGVLGNQIITPGDKVLDLGCGDGFYDGLFYFQKAKKIDALDRDPSAISQAKKLYKKPNIIYRLMDIITDKFPDKNYDVIFLFAAIEHFSITQGHTLLTKITKNLNKSGVFFGSTPLFKTLGGHNSEHENEFQTEKELELFLKPHFKQVKLWSSVWKKRTDCYFWCSKPK